METLWNWNGVFTFKPEVARALLYIPILSIVLKTISLSEKVFASKLTQRAIACKTCHLEMERRLQHKTSIVSALLKLNMGI